MPRHVLTVVAADVDADAGVGAVWMAWRPGGAGAWEYVEFLERCGGRWRCVGGADSAAVDPDGAAVIDVRDGSGALSLTRRLDPPCSVDTALWIACVRVYLGPDVGHVLVGDRRFDVPEQRGVVAVWKGPWVGRGARPVIVAFGRDGAELSRLGPFDSLDSRTWARVREALDGL